MRKLILICTICFIFSAGITSYMYFQKPDYNHLNIIHRFVARCATNNFEKTIRDTPPDMKTVIDYDTLIMNLNFVERDFVRRIFDIDQRQFGCNWQFNSVDKPKNLIEVLPETIGVGTNSHNVDAQFCAPQSYNDFVLMNGQMKKDIGKCMVMEVGFRSAGIQAYLYFKYLVTISGYSLRENSKKVAMPGYSQHNNPYNNAIDLCTEDGVNGFSGKQTAADIEARPEFQWLLNNAAKYNFYLTYPKNNKLGIAYEPWHWYWEKRNLN